MPRHVTPYQKPVCTGCGNELVFAISGTFEERRVITKRGIVRKGTVAMSYKPDKERYLVCPVCGAKKKIVMDKKGRVCSGGSLHCQGHYYRPNGSTRENQEASPEEDNLCRV